MACFRYASWTESCSEILNSFIILYLCKQNTAVDLLSTRKCSAIYVYVELGTGGGGGIPLTLLLGIKRPPPCLFKEMSTPPVLRTKIPSSLLSTRCWAEPERAPPGVYSGSSFCLYIIISDSIIIPS